ncbi:WD40 repeat-like protein [Schizophyllum commune H4-8]|uniref:WD40 repeat-like protein n=1 Tax=Schizophyllum commune (strain H4-8 / FGSC 9210) TaxID=578458 RepID=UPI00215DE878|nr:WD40 repeat-like protein [Schizophyllum commune H4-8]KAI5891985.1 WD40 repeat-like protein [Schizophyllum commune H4-8]
MLNRLQDLSRYVESGAHLDAQNAVFRIEEKLDNETTLRHLPMANTQAGTSKGCRPNTRVQLLAAIMDWAFDTKGPRCLILHGTAGKGKSAVANSVACILADMGAVAPFFAFDRTNPTRHAHQLYPTLAEKLARYDQHYLDELRSLRTEQLETIDIKDQHRYLMLSALRLYQTRVPTIFVVDALDECRNDDDNSIGERATLIRTLCECIQDRELPPSIRFLITTRPDDTDIAKLLRDDETIVVGRSIDHEENTESDIRKVVEENLRGTDASGLVDDVVHASQSLFECAAVLCRELTGPNQPKSSAARQDLIRNIRHEPGHPRLYEIYRLVLHTHIGTNDPIYLSTYRQFLAWVLSVRQPQPGVVFQEFAEVLLDGEKIDGMLVHLGSVLTGTLTGDGEPIRPLHTSFRDFVLDAEASGPFAIKPVFAAADSQLALACFGIMSRTGSGLRYNICDLPSPFVYKKDINDLNDRLTKQISPGLQYACRAVSEHLSRCHNYEEVVQDLVTALKAFLQNPFLFWLEACGWLGYEPCDVLQDMLEWVKIHESNDSTPLVLDFISFAKRYREAMSESPPQVYVTGLLFAPVDSHVSRLYGHRIVSPIDISGYEKEQEWPPSETLVIRAGSNVYSVAYSTDGTQILAGLGNYTLRIWDAETGRQIGSAMRGHGDRVWSVAFSPDGSTIASGSDDCTVRLWDAMTGQQQGQALRGHAGRVKSVAFSPDGTTVVSASYDCTLRLWDAKAGKEIGEAMQGHTDWVRSVVFSHDGACIVSGGDDRTVRIWDIDTRQPLGDSIRHEGWVRSVSISHDGKYVASGSDDGTIHVWDAGGRQQVWSLHGHIGWVYAVAFSSDSTRIVSGGHDDTVRIWDVASGAQVGDDLRGHTELVFSVAFSPDGKHVASGSDDGTIRVWDVREAKKESGIPVEHTRDVTSVACSPDGKYIVSGSWDKTVRLWNAETGEPVGDPMTGHDGEVNCVTFSPDSTRIASASDDRKVRVWDVETRLPVGVLQRHNSRALCVAFSPDATRLVSGLADGTLRLWDLATGQQIGEPLYGHENYVRFVSFSNDGLYIASGSDDHSIRLWDAKSQLQWRGPLAGHQDYVLSLAFSPDDVYLVSGSHDRTIRLWDVKTGEQMGGPLTGHTDRVRSVSFSPDGKYVVSGSDDRTVRVWSVQTRQQVGSSLRGHEGWVNSVAFTSDGARIVSGSGDGTIRVWDFAKLQGSENTVDAASAHTTEARVQSPLQEIHNHWLVYDGDGVERPILWIPHHLRQYPLAFSPFQPRFVPPTTPHIRIMLNDSFRLDE